jgi:hypothetical protein
MGGGGQTTTAISALSIDANTAIASMNYTARAYANGAGFQPGTGNVRILAQGNSVAHAGVNGGTSVNLIGIVFSLHKAYAGGRIHSLQGGGSSMTAI